MNDPLLDRFSDLNYPGKRAPVNRSKTIEEQVPASWDEKPLKYMVQGQEKEFFTISHLASALNRSVVTIRSWENKGLIPKTPYRSPRPRGETLPGTPRKGRRLWTREQILGILNIAQEEKVILNGKPPTKRFHDRVLGLFTSLSQKDSA
jgi:hypothetical protein